MGVSPFTKRLKKHTLLHKRYLDFAQIQIVENPKLPRMIRNREDLSLASRVVIKAGTSVVSTPDGYPSLSRMANIVEHAARLVHQGKEVMLVTSGITDVVVLYNRNVMKTLPRGCWSWKTKTCKRSYSEKIYVKFNFTTRVSL